MASDHHVVFMKCFDKTEHFSKHWKELGIRLGLEVHRLDRIEYNHPRNVDRCRLEMLSTWLNSTTSSTPEAELDAVLDSLQHTIHGEKYCIVCKNLQACICSQLQELMSSK